MNIIESAVAKLRTVKDEMPRFIAEVLEENATLIEDLNIKQLQAGTKLDGSPFPDYSKGSVSKYRKKPGPMTMHNTGALYRGVRARVQGQNLVIDDTDEKTAFLEKRYGPFIGLQDISIEELKQQILLSELQKKVSQFLLHE